MVLQASEIRAQLGLKQQAEFRDAEAAIDSALKFKGTATWQCSGKSAETIAKLIVLYKNAGWNVVHHKDYDQRENTSWDYLEIKL